MTELIDYLMAAHLLMIGVCLLLSVVWLVLRVSNAAVVLCHSVCSFARSVFVRAFPIKPTSTKIATASSQPIPWPARLASPAADAGPASGRIAVIAGENAYRVGKGSAQRRQHGSASKDHPDFTGEGSATAGIGSAVTGEGSAFTGEGAVRAGEGSATTLPATFSAKSNKCRQGVGTTPPARFRQ